MTATVIPFPVRPRVAAVRFGRRGAWHVLDRFAGARPVAKCGREGDPRVAKHATGDADCKDCGRALAREKSR